MLHLDPLTNNGQSNMSCRMWLRMPWQDLLCTFPFLVLFPSLWDSYCLYLVPTPLLHFACFVCIFNYSLPMSLAGLFTLTHAMTLKYGHYIFSWWFFGGAPTPHFVAFCILSALWFDLGGHWLFPSLELGFSLSPFPLCCLAWAYNPNLGILEQIALNCSSACGLCILISYPYLEL